MPHGGGHVGGFSGGHGGFGGGGGFGHHGFGRHHHHGFGGHHHHHHRHFHGPGWWYWWTPTYYYYGSPGYGYRRAYSCVCCWFWILFALVLTVIIVAASVGPSGSNTEYAHAPGDTRIISVSDSFCSGVSLTAKSIYTTTLYSLTKTPPLNVRNNFTVVSNSKTVDRRGGYVYWGYYLHGGSTFSVNMCLHSPGSVSLLYIKGHSNFNSWTNTAQEKYVKSTFFISSTCPSTAPKSYSVPSGYEDDWYIVVYNSRSSSMRFDFTLKVDRTEYSIISTDIISQCTASISCSIPTFSGATYLVRIDPGSSPNYEHNVDISTDCVVNGGVIAAIVIVPVVFFTVIVVAIIVAVCCYVKRKRKANTGSGYTNVPESTPVSTSGASVTITATAPPQPTVNPEYSTAPPPYAPPTANPPAYGSTEKPTI